jgi:predicted nucleic acid-binding Zn ribbon protein
MQDEIVDKLAYLEKRKHRMRKWFYAREPQAIGKVLGQVVINNRYASSESNAALEQAWASVVGPAVAARTQPTGIQRGKFEVTVAHSAIAQELSFDAGRIVKKLAEAFPETRITGLRYRVGTIG